MKDIQLTEKHAGENRMFFVKLGGKQCLMVKVEEFIIRVPWPLLFQIQTLWLLASKWIRQVHILVFVASLQ